MQGESKKINGSKIVVCQLPIQCNKPVADLGSVAWGGTENVGGAENFKGVLQGAPHFW